MTTPTPARSVVHLVDDNAGRRRSMSRRLRAANRYCRTYRGSDQFLRRLDDESPGCVILSLPDDEGLDTQRALRDRPSTLPVIFVNDQPRISTVVAAMRAGAEDFLTTPVDKHAVLAAVQRAVRRDRRLKARQRARQQIESRLATLTPREQETLEAVVSGLSNRQIAEQLGISPKTVELHRAHVMRKVGAGSVAELVRFYLWINELWTNEDTHWDALEGQDTEHPASTGRPFTVWHRDA